VAFAALAAWGVDPWPLAGGLAIAAPFAQAIGRLRCLVQGCCHGRPAAAGIGIVCTHPLSRVVRLAGLGGQALHPTQLYSLLWNLPCGLVLLRCAMLGQPPAVVGGLYLVLAGLGRFVEEGFRGEPQARHWGGMVEYQYYAILSVLVGACVTCLPSSWPAGTTPPWPLTGTAAMGLFVACAMGVDFPDSDRRFARLLK
jgi:prolipoprotein diacylglyceryltransferase